ncbi:hypothetical protein [uncultured Roseibium sp.]|uniref:hypothetical protein n=1 Tax=uncultured Roseibium sp. TaxID=1936171 RepID=UPI0026039546|nr:hypothetical protein [uncultured Roseibium sp.]
MIARWCYECLHYSPPKVVNGLCKHRVRMGREARIEAVHASKALIIVRQERKVDDGLDSKRDDRGVIVEMGADGRMAIRYQGTFVADQVVCPGRT